MSVPPFMSETALEAAGRQQEHLVQRAGPAAAPTFVVRTLSLRRGDIRPPSRGRGTLLIAPDSLVLTATRGGPGLVDRSRKLTVTTALLAPPWSNTFLLLHDRTFYIRVGIPMSASRKLRRALRDNGVTVRSAMCWQAPPVADSSLP